jgi:hypothetical protein
MKKIILVCALLVLMGCEAMMSRKGIVVSSDTREPIPGVTISYYGKKNVSDSLGRFDIGAFIGCGLQECPPFEVYFEKVGYELRYVNFSKEYGGYSGHDKEVEIALTPIQTIDKRVGGQKESSKGVLTYSRIAMLISFLTLLASFFLKIRFKLLWILLILWGNVSISYNVIMGTLNWDFLHFFLSRIYQYKWNIFLIPMGTVAYWVYYFGFYRKKLKMK